MGTEVREQTKRGKVNERGLEFQVRSYGHGIGSAQTNVARDPVPTRVSMQKSVIVGEDVCLSAFTSTSLSCRYSCLWLLSLPLVYNPEGGHSPDYHLPGTTSHPDRYAKVSNKVPAQRTTELHSVRSFGGNAPKNNSTRSCLSDATFHDTLTI